MKIKKNKTRFRSGATLIEAVLAMAVILIGILGTIHMRYHAVLDVRRAEVGATASRVALMLVEAWRGSAGSDAFDPIAAFSSELDIEADEGPEVPDGFTLLGYYKVELNNSNYFATLSYEDINAGLRVLNSTVSWEQRGNQDMEFDNADKTFALTLVVEK